MKYVLFLAIIIGSGSYLYTYKTNPSQISDPYYGEAQLNLKLQNREFSMVLLVEMVDLPDCQTRGQRSWRLVLENCDTCEFASFECKPELTERHQSLFAKEQTYTTYVAADRGSRFERDGRLIIWGLTHDESKEFCSYLTKTIKKKFSGDVSCIEGFSS